MKEFQEDKERKHEWDSDALDERPESVSDVFDQQDEALKEGDSPPVEGTPGSVSDIFDQQDEALKETDSPPLEKTPESVNDIFTKQTEALKEGDSTRDHIWEVNSPPIENVPEKKSNAKEIWENLTEEGKRLELVVKAELKKRHEKAQELDQLPKNIESSTKDKVKELKVQEFTLSQEGQRLQELVKIIREHRAQDKDGVFLDKLFCQGVEKITDSVTKISEKADDSTMQTVKKASRETEKDDSDRVESSLGPIRTGELPNALPKLGENPIANQLSGNIEQPKIHYQKDNPVDCNEKIPLQELNGIFESFLENDTIQYGYGILIPLESLERGNLAEVLKESDVLGRNYLKNPELGPFLDRLRDKLQLNRQEFSKLFGFYPADYSAITNNQKGVNIQKLVQFSDNATLKQHLTPTEMAEVNKKIETFLTSQGTTINFENGYQKDLNFCPDNCEKVRVGDREYVILPTSRWELKGKRNEMKQWVIQYYEKYKKAPIDDEFNINFPGFLDHEKKAYRRTWNHFLKECGVSINREIKQRTTNLIMKNRGEKPVNLLEQPSGENDISAKDSSTDVMPQETSKLTEDNDKFPPSQEFNQLFQEFLEDSTTKHGYGIIIPLELLNNGKLIETLKGFEVLGNFYLKNPELGSLLENLREKLQLSRTAFSQILEIHQGRYSTIAENLRGINLKKILYLPENPAVQNELTQAEIKSLKKNLETLITSKNTCLRISSQDILNFCPANLERIKIGTQDYVILPTSKWELKGKREEIKQWTIKYYEINKQAPNTKKFNDQFPGFLDHERRVYSRTWNHFLNECRIPLNYERLFDWTKPEHVEIVSGWIKEYNDRFHRSPPEAKLNEKFPGFLTHLIRYENKRYNEFLQKKGYPLNREVCEYRAWSDPANIKIVKDWIGGYVNSHGDAPPEAEITREFGGFIHYLRQRENLTYLEFLKSNGYPVIDFDEKQAEGYSFEKFGNDCMEILYGIHQYRVVHPVVNEYDHKYAIPDSIVHDFAKEPLKVIGKTVYLDDGQKLDMLIDFKRSFGGVDIKEWEIYTKMAKKLNIYILKGDYRLVYEKNGCLITFYSKVDLIDQLKMKKNPTNKDKIEFLIKKIHAIDRRLDIETQTEIHDYL